MMPHPRRFLFLSRFAVIIALAIAFALLLGATLLATVSTGAIIRANERAANAERTLTAATHVLASLNEVDTAARTYALTGDVQLQRNYEAARTRMWRDFAALRREYEVRSGIAPLLDDLHRATLAKSFELDRVVRNTAERRSTPPTSREELVESARLTGEIRQLGQLLQRQEFSELGEISADAVRRAELIQSLTRGLIGLSVALTATGAWLLLRRVRDLEGLITVCAWTRRVQWEGRWVSFEEYLLRRFHLRCTHGICDEAAEQMRRDASQLKLPLEISNH
jgi:CHASE3 domain sensor protein